MPVQVELRLGHHRVDPAHQHHRRVERRRLLGEHPVDDRPLHGAAQLRGEALVDEAAHQLEAHVALLALVARLEVRAGLEELDLVVDLLREQAALQLPAREQLHRADRLHAVQHLRLQRERAGAGAVADDVVGGAEAGEPEEQRRRGRLEGPAGDQLGGERLAPLVRGRHAPAVLCGEQVRQVEPDVARQVEVGDGRARRLQVSAGVAQRHPPLVVRADQVQRVARAVGPERGVEGARVEEHLLRLVRVVGADLEGQLLERRGGELQGAVERGVAEPAGEADVVVAGEEEPLVAGGDAARPAHPGGGAHHVGPVAVPPRAQPVVLERDAGAVREDRVELELPHRVEALHAALHRQVSERAQRAAELRVRGGGRGQVALARAGEERPKARQRRVLVGEGPPNRQARAVDAVGRGGDDERAVLLLVPADDGAAVAQPADDAGAAAGLGDHRRGVRLAAGDDVHRGEERVRAVEGGERAFGDLHPLDHLHRQVLGAQEGGEVGAEVHLHAVDHDLHDARPGAEAAGHAAHPHLRQHQVVDHVEPGHVGQDVGERAVAALRDLVVADGVDVGRRQRALLLAAARRHHLGVAVGRDPRIVGLGGGADLRAGFGAVARQLVIARRRLRAGGQGRANERGEQQRGARTAKGDSGQGMRLLESARIIGGSKNPFQGTHPTTALRSRAAVRFHRECESRE